MPKGLGQYGGTERKHAGGSDGIRPGSGPLDSSFLLKDRVGDGPSSDESHMPNPSEGGLGDLIDKQPAVRSRDWLPEGLLPEIDDLREEHLALLDSGFGSKLRELREQYEGEDAARAAAMRVGGEVPYVTPTAEREDALRHAEAERDAGTAKFGDFIVRAEALFRTEGPAWRARVQEKIAAANREREEAEAAARAAQREAFMATVAQQWLDKNIAKRGGRFFTFQTPDDELIDEALAFQTAAPDDRAVQEIASVPGEAEVPA